MRGNKILIFVILAVLGIVAAAQRMDRVKAPKKKVQTAIQRSGDVLHIQQFGIAFSTDSATGDQEIVSIEAEVIVGSIVEMPADILPPVEGEELVPVVPRFQFEEMRMSDAINGYVSLDVSELSKKEQKTLSDLIEKVFDAWAVQNARSLKN